ncbi:MAG: tetratricopeptide repeat protein, partial [Lachnospiraceae bacterium]|nr:tetratricopeptide repeat protein [Lachnospiraceae bacterium]
RELTKCREIDTNNTATQRYLKEVEEMLVPEEGVKQSSRKKQKADDIVKYQSGNETIIQPVNIREGKGVTSLLNLGIGVIIGIAIAIFLILPARIQASRADIDEDLRKVSEQSDAKTATIDELQQQVNELTKNNSDLQQDLEAYLGTDGKLRSVESLLKAADAYLTNPEEVTVVADYLEEIVQDDTEGGDGNSESFEDLYNTLLALVGPSVAQAYYDDGYEAYRQENYADAILNLEKAFKYDAANGDALYNLANSYYRTGEEEKAKEAYLQVIELFPNTEKASKSEAFLEEMENAE